MMLDKSRTKGVELDKMKNNQPVEWWVLRAAWLLLGTGFVAGWITAPYILHWLRFSP